MKLGIDAYDNVNKLMQRFYSISINVILKDNFFENKSSDVDQGTLDVFLEGMTNSFKKQFKNNFYCSGLSKKYINRVKNEMHGLKQDLYKWTQKMIAKHLRVKKNNGEVVRIRDEMVEAGCELMSYLPDINADNIDFVSLLKIRDAYSNFINEMAYFKNDEVKEGSSYPAIKPVIKRDTFIKAELMNSNQVRIIGQLNGERIDTNVWYKIKGKKVIHGSTGLPNGMKIVEEAIAKRKDINKNTHHFHSLKD